MLVQCPLCGVRLKIAEEHYGRLMGCPKCRQVLPVVDVPVLTPIDEPPVPPAPPALSVEANESPFDFADSTGGPDGDSADPFAGLGESATSRLARESRGRIRRGWQVMVALVGGGLSAFLCGQLALLLIGGLESCRLGVIDTFTGGVLGFFVGGSIGIFVNRVTRYRGPLVLTMFVPLLGSISIGAALGFAKAILLIPGGLAKFILPIILLIGCGGSVAGWMLVGLIVQEE
jgi:hypothetical protein